MNRFRFHHFKNIPFRELIWIVSYRLIDPFGLNSIQEGHIGIQKDILMIRFSTAPKSIIVFIYWFNLFKYSVRPSAAVEEAEAGRFKQMGR